MLKIIKLYLFSFIMVSSLLFSSPLLALNLKDGFSSTGNLNNFAKTAGYENKTKTPEDYIGIIITAFFSILGIIAIALLIYSGFVWMTARGNEDRVKKAKDNIINILIGLIVIFGSYALTVFILKIFI